MPTAEEIRDLREGWIAALRGGQYRQTKDRLRDEDGYCCLGVACDVSDLGVWKLNFYAKHTYATPTDPPAAATLPESVREALGITTNDADRQFLISLMKRNDRGDTFEEIANYIESYFAGRL